MTAERDALLARVQADAHRHARARATQRLIMAIMADYPSEDAHVRLRLTLGNEVALWTAEP